MKGDSLNQDQAWVENLHMRVVAEKSQELLDRATIH